MQIIQDGKEKYFRKKIENVRYELSKFKKGEKSCKWSIYSPDIAKYLVFRYILPTIDVT